MDQVEEVKNRLNLVDVVKDYIKLEKAGANFRAKCPFHSDKKPSFFVSPSKQIWKCFGCGAGGDVFEFVKEIEGVEFGEALRVLARKAGVELKRVSPEMISRKKRLYELTELSCRFFEKQLKKGKVGRQARQYLVEERGISESSIKEWRLGYGPDKWRSLTRFLTSCGFTKNEIQKTGLAVLNKKGNLYDRFRGRIIFPVFDLHGRVVGFGGRIFKNRKEKKGAKYLNTPNTVLYNKSRVLYGLNKAKVAVREKDACIVAEGYTDVILSRQEGVKNIVASSGTALTPYQLRILNRYTSRLMFAFDMDTAGSSATKRGISLAQRKGFDIQVLLMPGSHDPADVIKEDPDQWRGIVEGARDILEFYFQTTFEKFDPENPGDKKKIAQTLLPVVKRIPNEIVRFHWVQRLAERLKVTEESVTREMRKIELKKEEKEEDPVEVDDSEKRDKGEMMEEQLLFFIIQKPEAIEVLEKEDLEFFSPEGVELFSVLRKHGVDLEDLEEKLSPSLFQKLQMASLEVEVQGEVENVEEEIEKCILNIQNFRRRQRLKALSERLKEAEKQEDESKIEMLTQEFNNLSKKIEKND